MIRASSPLNIERLLAGRNLVVAGATGFLGKVWLSLVLTRYPTTGQLYLLVRRKGQLGGVERFWQETLHSEAFQPLREQHQSGFEAFMRSKIVPIEGDIVLPFCGVPEASRDELQGKIAALVNASGVVDFEPPLDVGLEVNAFGVQNLVALARSLGDCPLLHTSTCFVAGNRTGFVEEEDPRLHPFPRAHELERAHWDPDREIAECLSIIEQAKQRAEDAFRQSHFLDQARANLTASHEPLGGQALEQEVERVKRRYIEARLAEMGNERARFWGWPNTYTYTKSIGEQIAVASGLPVTIVRPAIVETSVRFPMIGWNEGINTSAPLIYAIREGQTQLPGSAHNLDMIPCDMVAGAMVMALGELLEGTAPFVYQLGASDSNPVTMARIFELTGLYKRKHHLNRGKPSLGSAVQAHVEGALFSSESFEKYGPKMLARGARGLGEALCSVSVTPAVNALARPAMVSLEQFARSQERIARLLWQFAPFTADYDYTFRCDHVRAARARLNEQDRAWLYWEPEAIDWRQWFLEVHAPALERWVFPEIERRRARPPRPLRAHESLTALLDDMSERHDLAVALQYTEKDGLSRISYRQLRACALACANRLMQSGVKPGDAVLLVGDNHPDWVVAFFGILYASATVVPVDAYSGGQAFVSLAATAGATLCVADAEAKARWAAEATSAIEWRDLQTIAQAGKPLEVIRPCCDRALLCFGSNAGGVAFSQANLTRSIANLALLSPLGTDDRLMSVLPLHEVFEIVCGLLLPLSRGARVVYVDQSVPGGLEQAMKTVRPTVVVGVPSVWEELAAAVGSEVEKRGAVASRGFAWAGARTAEIERQSGVSVGRLVFASMHRALGGQLQYLISDGSAVSESTRTTLKALGLCLSDRHGVIEGSALDNVSRNAASGVSHDQNAVPVAAKLGSSDDLAEVFNELLKRFLAGAVTQPICYYFSLGDERWTVQITPDSCQVTRGKAVEVADCVMKTSPALFTRMVREAYSPGVAEVLSGQFKSNNVPALKTFQKAFQLN